MDLVQKAPKSIVTGSWTERVKSEHIFFFAFKKSNSILFIIVDANFIVKLIKCIVG